MNYINRFFCYWTTLAFIWKTHPSHDFFLYTACYIWYFILYFSINSLKSEQYTTSFSQSLWVSSFQKSLNMSRNFLSLSLSPSCVCVCSWLILQLILISSYAINIRKPYSMSLSLDLDAHVFLSATSFFIIFHLIKSASLEWLGGSVG